MNLHKVPSLPIILLLSFFSLSIQSQENIQFDSHRFSGMLHDNISNAQRQGSGFTPLTIKSYPRKNIFRDDAVGFNFEHIFNGAKDQHGISMFTPRKDPCSIIREGDHKLRIDWPANGSQWKMKASMIYDFSNKDYIDITFKCSPMRDMYPQGYVAMMWASYMQKALDRKIHFWGKDGDRIGWVSFGENLNEQIEVGTVAHQNSSALPYEKGSQNLNIVEHTTKKFMTPFYYGLLDGDQNLSTINDKLLYMVLFDQTDSIRFAMWNFYKDESGEPDTHSPAWDWQFAIKNPQIGKTYSYKARIIIKPYKGTQDIWKEYQSWQDHLDIKLPKGPEG